MVKDTYLLENLDADDILPSYKEETDTRIALHKKYIAENESVLIETFSNNMILKS